MKVENEIGRCPMSCRTYIFLHFLFHILLAKHIFLSFKTFGPLSLSLWAQMFIKKKEKCLVHRFTFSWPLGPYKENVWTCGTKRILLPQDESLHLLPFLVYWALKAHKKGRSKDSYTRSLDTFSLHFFFNRSSRTRRNEVNGKCIVEILYAWSLLLQKLFVIFLITRKPTAWQ